MELKKAIGVCLISLFSATLVVLIARSLDSQAAARLEPQLARIVEELEAIRTQGGIAAPADEAAALQTPDNALMVYYFHGVRCETCLAAEATALATLESHYAAQLKDGEIVWRVLDYMTDPAAKKMAIDFDVITASVVLVKMKDGRIDSWNRLDQTLALAEDKPALSDYLQKEIDEMLTTAESQSDTETSPDGPAIPVPEAEADSLPLPTGPAEIPLPE